MNGGVAAGIRCRTFTTNGSRQMPVSRINSSLLRATSRRGSSLRIYLLKHSRMGLCLYANHEVTTTSERLPNMAFNNRSDPNSHYPSTADAGTSITQNGFKVTTRKLPILKAEPIEQMTTSLGIAPPEMIFGDNMVSIEHSSGWGINFNTYDALDRVDKTGGSMLQVAHSREWQSTRYDGAGERQA